MNNNSPLEFLARKYGNVIKYDNAGNIIGIFVRFHKRKSSELVDGLPDHIHPAFIINGVVQESILLGKYKVGETGESGGKLVSMPNIMPGYSFNSNEMLSRIRAAGTSISGMTCADYGFIKLLAQKEGWNPKGNTDWESSHKDGIRWKVGEYVQGGTERIRKGYLYKCLITHTTTTELRPEIAPKYWKKKMFVSGASMDTNGHRTLNGTGPLDWYLGSNPGNLCDVIGSLHEFQYGCRIVDCELQIMENNNAADPSADLSAESPNWKAILPNKNDDGYTLVAPGTTGTLHWNWDGNKIQLDTQCDLFDATYKNSHMFLRLQKN